MAMKFKRVIPRKKYWPILKDEDCIGRYHYHTRYDDTKAWCYIYVVRRNFFNWYTACRFDGSREKRPSMYWWGPFWFVAYLFGRSILTDHAADKKGAVAEFTIR